MPDWLYYLAAGTAGLVVLLFAIEGIVVALDWWHRR